MTTSSKADILAPGVGRSISAKLGVQTRTALGCTKVRPMAMGDRPGVQLTVTIGRASRLVVLQEPTGFYTVIAYRGSEVLGSQHIVKHLHAAVSTLTGVPLEDY